MERRRWLVRSTLAVGLLVLGGLGWFYALGDWGRVRSILKVAWLPTSVREITCKDDSWTDTSVTCYFAIDPSDFPKLLTGLAFKEGTRTGHTNVLGKWPGVGPDFEMTTEFFVALKEYKNGGHVMVLTDSERRHVIVDLYIE